MSFVYLGKRSALVFQGLWFRAAFWLLKFRVAQDASQDQAGSSANFGWFECADYHLQTETMNQGW